MSEMPDDRFSRGLGTGCLLHLLLIPVGMTISLLSVFFYPRPFVGLSGLFVGFYAPVAQLLYLIPAYVKYRRRGFNEAAKGIVFVACITALVCAPCWLILK